MDGLVSLEHLYYSLLSACFLEKTISMQTPYWPLSWCSLPLNSSLPHNRSMWKSQTRLFTAIIPYYFIQKKKKLQKKSKLKKVNLTWDFSHFFQKRHLASTPPEAYPCINCCFMQANSLSITQCLMSPCLEHDKSCWGGLVLSPSQSRKDLGLLPVQHLAGM